MRKIPAEAAIRGMVAASDLALLIDKAGVIEEVTLGTPDLGVHGVHDWLGQFWGDTVHPENRVKVKEIFEIVRKKRVQEAWIVELKSKAIGRDLNH